MLIDIGIIVFFIDIHSDHLIRFEEESRIKRGSSLDLDGVPFMIVGTKLMECHQGPSHNRNSTQEEVYKHA